MSHAKVFSPRLDHRLAFAEKMSHDLTMDVQAVSTAEEALKSADILITGIDSAATILETTHRREIVPYKHGIGIMDIGLRAYER
jgi:ornithine cyclodeaminase/alanine dehydrogenase-like protein (mu-crystallin family)